MKSSTKVLMVIFFNLVLVNHSFPQNVLHVPSQYPTIQSAIDASNTGDTIIVQPGTYYENVVINNIGDIVLISAQGSETTIIFGNNQSATLFIDGSSFIEGFTLRNGSPGLSVQTEFPKLKNLIVKENLGGGIEIHGNENDFALLENITVENNNGSGLRITRGNIMLRDIIIRNNHNLLQNGGGVYISESQLNYTIAHFSKIYIYNNTAENGGGIYFHSGQATFDSSYIVNNSSTQGGGIFSNSSGTLELENSFICNNVANSAGGIKGDENTTLVNSSLCLNSANYGSGMVGDCYFQNSTIANNIYNPSNSGALRSSPNLIISQCNILGNKYAVRIESTGSAANGENNWWGDPTGPYHPSQNPQGHGDTVNVYVDVTPYLTSPNLDAPPMPVQNLQIITITQSSVSFSWEQSPLSDILGYKVHYDTTYKNIFYSNTIDVGNVLEYELQNLQQNIKYYISVTCYDVGGNTSWYSKPIGVLNGNPLSVEIKQRQVESFFLSQNYPNPFNPSTTIKYGIPEKSFVELKVYDIIGREVVLLVSEEQDAGYYELNFNAARLSSGVYLYQLKAGSFIKTKKMVLIR